MQTSHHAPSEPQKKGKCKVWLNTHGQNGLTVNIIIFAVVVTAGSVVKATSSDVVIVIVMLMDFNWCIYDKELGRSLKSKWPKVFLPLQSSSSVHDIQVFSKITLLYTVPIVQYVKQHSIWYKCTYKCMYHSMRMCSNDVHYLSLLLF